MAIVLNIKYFVKYIVKYFVKYVDTYVAKYFVKYFVQYFVFLEPLINAKEQKRLCRARAFHTWGVEVSGFQELSFGISGT